MPKYAEAIVVALLISFLGLSPHRCLTSSLVLYPALEFTLLALILGSEYKV